MKNKAIIVFVFLFQIVNLCSAQWQGGSFRPQKTIIFSDDFSNDLPGVFPNKWHIDCTSCNHLNFKSTSKNCTVEHWGDTFGIRIIPSKSREDWIKPTIDQINYLPDSFTLEYDFMLEAKDASCNLYFIYCDNCLCEVFYMYNKGNYKFILAYGGYREFMTDGEKTERYDEGEREIHRGCDSASWHHFALAYYKGIVNCYVDRRLMMQTVDTRYTPKQILLNCNHGNGAIRYANFRLATGDYITWQEIEDFNKLLTKNKLVTHSILFDVNSSVIKPESLLFIKKFAEFLKKNPGLRLEIDGHTDSDGIDANNMALSQRRAAEVKRQLVSLGISCNRLTVRGYGARKPISPNLTPEGKSNNRRVEFINK